MALLPKPPQTATLFLGLLFDLVLPRLRHSAFSSQDQMRTTLLTTWGKAAFCSQLEPTNNPFRAWRKVLSQHLVLCFWHQPLTSFSANLFLPLSGELSPSLLGLSAFISPGKDFLSVSTKAQEERNWPFVHNLATVWYGVQWEEE